MILVRQTNHRTCQHACVAMLAGVTIEEVIAFIGDKELGFDERMRCFHRFGIETVGPSSEGFVVGVAENPLIQLMREHEFLWCSVADWKDPAWGHAVLIWDKILYDPWRGMIPDWPWTRHIWRVQPVRRAQPQPLGAPCAER